MRESKLEGAVPICPLTHVGPVDRAWVVQRGDTVLLRLPTTSSDAFELARENLLAATRRTGVEFVLLGPGVEVVSPKGDPEKDRRIAALEERIDYLVKEYT